METIYILYKTAQDLSCPIILGVFYESGEALEHLEPYLIDYYKEVEDTDDEDKAQEYSDRVTDALAESGEYTDEHFCESFYLKLTTLGEIDNNPFIR